MPRIAGATLLLLFMRLGLEMSAQNLIPNPGFEDAMSPTEYQWVQPQGPYYHYEKKPGVGADGSHSGHYINGLCMYNHEPNEYLHVKLKAPLKAHERYVFTVYARLYRSKADLPELHQYIGVHFGQRGFSTHVPGDLNFNPQLHLRLPDGPRFDWFLLSDTLTAKGGEEYLTMGYFPRTQRRENDEKRKDAFMADVERMHENATRKAEDDDKSWLYLPPSEQKVYLKNRKKEQKKVHKQRAQEPCPEPVSPRQPNPNRTMAPVPAYAVPGHAELFTVRYYFDDFCLALLSGAEVRCDTAPEDGLALSLKTGNTIALPNVFFELDEDLLLNESVVQLEALKETLQRYPALQVEIRGHTDRQGSDVHNLDLSRRRAAAVVTWLKAHSIEPYRLSSKGFGAAKPIANNDDEAGRARNRRVEFYVVSGL
jgi:outer membrane protein OmpA-like peptidoglycan-associated protein